MSTGIVIVGTGVVVPQDVITNDELCEAFNVWVRAENQKHQDAIDAGTREPLKESNAEFIEHASGITQRHVHDKHGILDPTRMMPKLPERPDSELSYQAEFALQAANKALVQAKCSGGDIDMVLLASSNLQRMYPSVGMEVQHALGAKGFAYDISVGCSSATFPIQIAVDALRNRSCKRALLVNPEIMCGHLNWRDRDSHFIFGDAATAIVLERKEESEAEHAWEILGTELMSTYSTNIRNNGGYLSRLSPSTRDDPDKLFYQQGRKVFKDVIPMAADFIAKHVRSLGLEPNTINRYWLHQANANMNRLISKRLLGRDAIASDAPTILNRYGNTASCGSIICFNHHQDDLPSSSVGVLCSFGAGYSIGSVVIRRL